MYRKGMWKEEENRKSMELVSDWHARKIATSWAAGQDMGWTKDRLLRSTVLAIPLAPGPLRLATHLLLPALVKWAEMGQRWPHYRRKRPCRSNRLTLGTCQPLSAATGGWRPGAGTNPLWAGGNLEGSGYSTTAPGDSGLPMDPTPRLQETCQAARPGDPREPIMLQCTLDYNRPDRQYRATLLVILGAFLSLALCAHSNAANPSPVGSTLPKASGPPLQTQFDAKRTFKA